MPAGLVGTAVLAGLLIHVLWPQHIWINVPLHSTLEALGGLSAILTGLVLLARKVEWEDERLQGLSSGLLGMGILEGFHAVAHPDQGFVLLRSPNAEGVMMAPLGDIPDDPLLCGAPVHWQYAVLDPNGPTGKGTVTKGMSATFGD